VCLGIRGEQSSVGGGFRTIQDRRYCKHAYFGPAGKCVYAAGSFIPDLRPGRGVGRGLGRCAIWLVYGMEVGVNMVVRMPSWLRRTGEAGGDPMAGGAEAK
jgi:hypothetical protein